MWTKFLIIRPVLGLLIGHAILLIGEVVTAARRADPEPVVAEQAGLPALPVLATREPAVALGVVGVQADVVVPGDEAARVAAVAVDVGLGVVARGADVVRPGHLAELGMPECPDAAFDEGWGPVMVVRPA